MERSDGESDVCSSLTENSRRSETRCQYLSQNLLEKRQCPIKFSNNSNISDGRSSEKYLLSKDDFGKDSGDNRIGKRRRIVSIDCEMVGVGEKKQSALARCSIIDYFGRTLFDKYIKPGKKITDFRTRVSGIKPCHMKNALPYNCARKRIKRVLKNKIIIGHALHMDMKALGLHFNSKYLRDTSRFMPLKIMSCLPLHTTPSLRNLSKLLLGRTIQIGTHCSVEDATAALDLYKYVEEEWEEELDAKCDSRKYLNDKFWPSWV